MDAKLSPLESLKFNSPFTFRPRAYLQCVLFRQNIRRELSPEIFASIERDRVSVLHKLREVSVSIVIAETRVRGNCRDLLVNIRRGPVIVPANFA